MLWSHFGVDLKVGRRKCVNLIRDAYGVHIYAIIINMNTHILCLPYEQMLFVYVLYIYNPMRSIANHAISCTVKCIFSSAWILIFKLMIAGSLITAKFLSQFFSSNPVTLTPNREIRVHWTVETHAKLSFPSKLKSIVFFFLYKNTHTNYLNSKSNYFSPPVHTYQCSHFISPATKLL